MLARPLKILASIAAFGRAVVLVAACAGWLNSGKVCAQPARSAAAAPALLDNMDNLAPALKLLDPVAGVHIVGQSIEPGLGQFGNASERIILNVPAGSSAQLAYDLPPAAIIQELRLAATISCNRPGAQLAATVVLPRSIDAQSGAPRQLLVRSGKMSGGRPWEEIVLDDLPGHLADQARVARAKYGGDVDERGAYVSQLVILAPGGPGMTELAVDQITVHGVLGTPGKPSKTLAANVPAEGPIPASLPSPLAPPVKRPSAPRIIQWQGEPLALLQKIGFDAVWMGRLPTTAEMKEATRLGMFLVCPPPPHEQLVNGLGPEFNQVLAWDLGPLTGAGDIELAHRWAQAIEQHETIAERPVLLQPFGMTREASRIADAILIGRPMLGSTQTWPDFAAHLVQERRLSKLGTQAWVAIETHSSPRFMAQLAALRGQGAAIVPATLNELSHASTAAFGITPRGFCFQSHTSLAGGDVDNQLRSLALELTNLRLGLAEPWLAGGRIPAAARSTRPELTGMVLKVERSHLIIPLRWADAEMSTNLNLNQQPISFDLPGVPESCDSYLISISGSQRLTGRRVTGGLRISLDHLPDDAFILVTEDGYAFSHVERYLRQHSPRATQVRLELATLRRQQATGAIGQLAPDAVKASGALDSLAAADAQLTAVNETLRRRDFAAAFACAAEAERLLDQAVQRLAGVVTPDMPAGTSPSPPALSTLVDIARVDQAVRQSRIEPQLIPGGEFESLDGLLDAGWQRVQTSPESIETAVRLSPEAPARGMYCLDLDARTANSQSGPPLLAAPPVWVTSPPIQVPAGHVVEITGTARISEVPIGSPDPLLIFDSIGGEESAIRVRSAPSWTPFRMVRAVSAASDVRVTVALGGVGRAQVDSLSFRFIPIRTDAVAQTPPQTR